MLHTSFLLLGAALLAYLSVRLILQARALRRIQQSHAQLLERLAGLENGLQGLCAGARNMGDGLAGIEQRLRRISERQDTLDMREPDVATYQQAITLVQQGADVGKLMQACGLARNEAELIHLMHHQQASLSLGAQRLSA